jgi:hypothetical protein
LKREIEIPAGGRRLVGALCFLPAGVFARHHLRMGEESLINESIAFGPQLM